MLSLFLDTSYNSLNILILKDDEVISKKTISNIVKVSDILNDEINSLLNEQNLKLKDVNSLYVTKGPGSFTGVRVAVTFAKTLKVINPEIKVYSISSLLFQVGLDVGISYIDAKGGKTYFGIYNTGNVEISEQLLDSETAVAIANDFEDYNSYYDMLGIDIEKNFKDLKPFFKEETNIEDFNPVYIKKFI